MSQGQVTVTSHPVAPTTPSLPVSLQRLLSAVQGTWQRPTLPASMMPSKSDLRALQEHCQALRRDLIAGPETEITAAVVQLLLAFPAQNMRENEAKQRAVAFLTALSDQPAWAVQLACRDWLRGDNSKGNENYAFAPSPPQLVRLARIHRAVATGQLASLDRVARAEPERELSDAYRADMSKRLEGLAKDLRLKNLPKDLKRQEKSRYEPQGR